MAPNRVSGKEEEKGEEGDDVKEGVIHINEEYENSQGG